jgi:TRAP-type C4-dicarboxylate transport system substrate-binding protein
VEVYYVTDSKYSFTRCPVLANEHSSVFTGRKGGIPEMSRTFKLVILFAVIIFVFGGIFTACKEPAPTTPKPTQSPSPSPTPAPAEKIVWKGQSFGPTAPIGYGPFPPGDAGTFSIVKKYSDWLFDATGGRIEIEWVDPGAIVPTVEVDQAIANGVFDVAWHNGLYYGGRIPEALIETGFPLGWKDVQAEWECMFDYGLYDGIKEAYMDHNIVWEYFAMDSNIGIGTNFIPDTPEAFQGKKIRAVGNWGEMVKLLGGSPMATGFAEQYQAMKLGTVDGWYSAPAVLEDLKMKEVTKYYLRDPIINTTTTNLLISKESWDALPEDIKTIIHRDTRYVSMALTSNWHQQCEWVSRNSESEYGIKFYSWSPEDTARVRTMLSEELWPVIGGDSARVKQLRDIIYKQLRDDYGYIK